MPERQEDNSAVWTFPTPFPGSDLRVHPVAVRAPLLVEAVGLDGRFIGAIRPFPGMADKTVHGIPSPSASTTVTSIANITFAKYVSIRKGTSSTTLKGIILIGDNSAGTGKSIYFACLDSSGGTDLPNGTDEDVVELEDMNSWLDYIVDFTSNSDPEIDITSLGAYIYMALSGDTDDVGTEVPFLVGKALPYNKAYFWDWKINDWDRFVTGFDDRFMGLQPRRAVKESINERFFDGNTAFDSEATFFAKGNTNTSGGLAPGHYTIAIELVSRKHNLRSYMRLFSWESTETAPLRITVGRGFHLPDGVTRQVKDAAGSSVSCQLVWGIPHMDGYRVWRTPVDIRGSGESLGIYELVGGLYLLDNYIDKLTNTDEDNTTRFIYLNSKMEIPAGTEEIDPICRFFADGGLFVQPRYDPFLDDFGTCPRLKRIVAWDGLLIGVTDIEQPDNPGNDWQTTEQIPDSFVWSATHTGEPENFPPENSYILDVAGEKVLSLELAGDHLFGVTTSGVYKFTRSGAAVAVTRLQFKMGGVSRYAQTGVGNSLFIVTRVGIREIDGNTGRVRNIPELNRLITDEREWAGTLSSIFMEYDASVGALILLNTSKKEAAILWESTGAITRLEDVPWTFLTGGPEGNVEAIERAFFITSTGGIQVIDGAREMGKRTMCGTASGETVNGKATGGSTTTSLEDTTATFPVNCVGFEVHFLSGDRAGTSSTISARVSATVLTIASGATLAADDRYSIAPVITRITLSQLVSQEGQSDPFVRKVAVSMAASFSNLGGETGSSDVNGKFKHGIKDVTTVIGQTEVAFNRIPDKTFGSVNFHATRPFPYLEFKGSNQDWELQAVIVKGILSASEAQSRQGTS